MTAPLKPWERGGINNQRLNTGTSFTDQMSSSPTLAGPRVSTIQNPPPIPARNALAQRPSYNSGFGGYGYGGGGYGGGYGSMYSPMGMYSGGMYGGTYGMNRFGNGMDDGSTSGFAQQAELSSRQAFQSIESVVQAVGSVAAMLESTFQAVYNSFRAVIGVADHMSRLRSHLTRIFSALAIFRTLKWLAYRLLNFLRLRSATGLEDELWSRATVDAVTSNTADFDIAGTNRSSWPVMLFFAIVVGGPWLIWKFLSTLSGSNASKGWVSGTDDHFVAVAEYPFEAENADELSFQQGNMLNVAPKELQPNVRGWLLASLNGQKTGLIPANYVKVIGKRRGKPTTDPVKTQSSADTDLSQQFDSASFTD